MPQINLKPLLSSTGSNDIGAILFQPMGATLNWPSWNMSSISGSWKVPSFPGGYISRSEEEGKQAHLEKVVSGVKNLPSLVSPQIALPKSQTAPRTTWRVLRKSLRRLSNYSLKIFTLFFFLKTFIALREALKGVLKVRVRVGSRKAWWWAKRKS